MAGATFDNTFVEDIVRYQEKQLSLLCAELKKKYVNLVIDNIAETGTLVAVIEQELNKKTYHLVGIGSNGSTNFYEKLIGSSAKAILRLSNIPVLVVPVATKLIQPAHILVAVDASMTNVTTELEVFVKELVQRPIKITLFHINIHQEDIAREMSQLKDTIKKNDSEIELNMVSVQSSGASVDNQILEYAEQQAVDLLITYPHNHSLLERMFAYTINDKLLENKFLPLLALKK
jgi:nucleotide-binding universal stress UspA family protein